MKTLRFIGGPADGHEIDVDDDVQIYLLNKVKCSCISNICENNPKMLPCEPATYRRRKIYGVNAFFEIMLLQDLSLDQLYQLLLDNYVSDQKIFQECHESEIPMFARRQGD